MATAKRKLGPRPHAAPDRVLEQYVSDLEFELELERLYEERDLPPAATESLRHRVTESPDDDL